MACPAETGQAMAAVEVDLQAIAQLRQALNKLDPTAKTAALDFSAAQAEIAGAVDKRLTDTAAHQQEAERARAARQKAKQAIGTMRTAVKQIGVDAGKAADAAQDASRGLAGTMKQLLLARSRPKAVVIAVSEVHTTANRFRLNPLQDTLKSATRRYLPSGRPARR